MRSKYLHEGNFFAEGLYSSAVGSTDLDLIGKKPTYFGVEQLRRNSLLQFAQDNGFYMDTNA